MQDSVRRYMKEISIAMLLQIQSDIYIYIYIYIYICILKIMKNESLLCFCTTRFTAVAALQA